MASKLRSAPTTPGKLGKRVQNYISDASQQNKEEKAAQDRKADNLLQRSLQMGNDHRHKEIVSFQEKESISLEKVMKDMSRGNNPRRYPEQWGFPEPLGKRSACRMSLFGKGNLDVRRLAEGESTQFKETTQEKFGGRIEWEDNFRSNVKQLMLDLELTDDPQCRLNHLDRMHNFFCGEGKKMARKEQAAPQFLTFDKDDYPNPGSMRKVPAPSNPTVLNLAKTICFPASERLEKHFGVVPAPPPPRPCYK